MSWSGKRVLVTGAGGFIGSHLVERLVREGARARALVRYGSTGSWGWLDRSSCKAEVEVVAGDVRDAERVRAALEGVEVVFHLAALIGIPYSYEAARSYLQVNVEGTLNVLQAARAVGARVVHTSTSEVYGTARRVPIDEEHPLEAQSPYAASKIGADQLAGSFHRAFGLPVATVRPFNAFGPRQSARAVIPAIITQALWRPEVRLGRLDPTRDFNFVADTVDGFVRAGARDEALGQVVNLSTGREVTIGETARLVLRLLGKELPVVEEASRVRPAGSEVERLCGANGRAERLLGWRPTTTLEEGLAATIEWIRANEVAYRPGRYVV